MDGPKASETCDHDWEQQCASCGAVDPCWCESAKGVTICRRCGLFYNKYVESLKHPERDPREPSAT
jgi:hypothetical protein